MRSDRALARISAGLVLSVGLSACSQSAGSDVSTQTRIGRSGPVCGVGDVGVQVGSAAEDFALRDQQGRTVLLSDFCGKTVAIQFGAMWCPICQAEAEKLPAYEQQFADQQLVILSLLAEDADFEPIEVADLAAWADYFDLSSPVLADVGWQVWDRYFEVRATPRVMIVSPQGEILSLGYQLDAEDYQSALDAAAAPAAALPAPALPEQL